MNIKIVIQLPERLKGKLDDLANDLYDDFKGVYATKDQFFITLRDIGNVDSYKLKQIKSALHSITSKSDPFTLFCDELMLLNPRRKSSLIYTIRGLTSKLYNLDQNIENALYTRGIEREGDLPSPNIEIAQKVAYKQLPIVKVPDIPIEVGSIELLEKKQKFMKVEYEKIAEFPLFGGQLYVKKIEDATVTCQNSLDKEVNIDITEMPNDIKEKDVIIKSGAQYSVDVGETRLRAIKEQIKREKN